MNAHDVKTARVVILPDAEAVAHHVAHWLFKLAIAKTNGPFSIALSGGSTPKRLFELLAHRHLASRFPWQNVQFFFGDERHVPVDDPASNYAMSHAALFAHVPVPPENIHAMPTTGTPEKDAALYERELKTFYGADTLQSGRPLFDVVLLGMGADGHTASLFPRQPVLKDVTHWVSTCVPDDAPHTRLTLTYPAIHSSRHVVFMLAGEAKADMFARVRRGDDASLPSSHVTSEGDISFIVDRAAARDVVSGDLVSGDVV